MMSQETTMNETNPVSQRRKLLHGNVRRYIDMGTMLGIHSLICKYYH